MMIACCLYRMPTAGKFFFSAYREIGHMSTVKEKQSNKKSVIILITAIVLMICLVAALVLFLIFGLKKDNDSVKTDDKENYEKAQIVHADSQNPPGRLFNEAIDYLDESFDFLGYELDMEDTDGKGYQEDIDGHWYSCKWNRVRPAQPDYPLSVTIEGVKITLGRTTRQDMIDNGLLNGARENKTNFSVSYSGSDASSVVTELTLYGNEFELAEKKEPVKGSFSFNGLEENDTLDKALLIFDEPDSIYVYSHGDLEDTTVKVTLDYLMGDKEIHIIYSYYGDNINSQINEIKMSIK